MTRIFDAVASAKTVTMAPRVASKAYEENLVSLGLSQVPVIQPLGDEEQALVECPPPPAMPSSPRSQNGGRGLFFCLASRGAGNHDHLMVGRYRLWTRPCEQG